MSFCFKYVLFLSLSVKKPIVFSLNAYNFKNSSINLIVLVKKELFSASLFLVGNIPPRWTIGWYTVVYFQTAYKSRKTEKHRAPQRSKIYSFFWEEDWIFADTIGLDICWYNRVCPSGFKSHPCLNDSTFINTGFYDEKQLFNQPYQNRKLL